MSDPSLRFLLVCMLVVAAVSMLAGGYLGRTVLCERLVAMPVMEGPKYVRPALYCEVPVVWSFD